MIDYGSRPALIVALVTILCFSATSSRARQTASVLAKLDGWATRTDPKLRTLLGRVGLQHPPQDVFLQVYKFEGVVELWARNDTSAPFTMVTTYPAYNLPKNYRVDPTTDDLDGGPKQRQGDSKVPEGLYRVLYHNPWSSYHLSLALNYPNPADAIRARSDGVISTTGERVIRQWWRDHGRTVDTEGIAGVPSAWSNREALPAGNEIFMHGKRVTIGCVPVGDDNIEQIFVLTDHRRVGGTQVHIYPFRFDDPGTVAMRRRYERRHPWLRDFWQGLEEVHQAFRRTRRLPPLYVDETTGNYHVQPGPSRFAY